MSELATLAPENDLHSNRTAYRAHRLNALDKLDSLVRNHRLIVARQKRLIKEGATAVWNGLMWDNSVLYACDAIPLQIHELWRDNHIESQHVGEADFQIPEEFCAPGKAIAGRLRLWRDVTGKRILVFGTGCDPRSIAYEMLKKDGYDVYTIDGVTANPLDFNPDRHEAYVRYLTKEFEGVAVWLTGKPFDEHRLRAEIAFKNRVLARVQTIVDLRLKNPLLLPQTLMMPLMMGCSHFYDDRPGFIEALDSIISELEVETERTTPGRYIPLVITGLVGKVLKNVEESGGAVLASVRFGSELFREDVPPAESIARYLLNCQLRGEGHDVSGAPAAQRRYLVEELYHKTGARGIISGGLVSCPYFDMAAQLDQDYFKKKGIPFIAVQSPGTGPDTVPGEEQVTRVKAFIEMLS
jgi:benzoyl-CoA reductase/2-hydroxyglutaryl-CoA dehydratase subunit BcrC/BadD/HgdB